jgi:hypothetical protein
MAQDLVLRNLKAQLEALGREYVSELTRQLLSEDKVATGQLINSLDYEVLDTVNGLVLKILADDYLTFVDKGRRPGKRPPQKVIQKWVENRGIKIQKQTSSQTAFIIARSIGKKGIKPTNVLKKTQESIFNNIQTLVSKGIQLDVNEYLKNLFE